MWSLLDAERRERGATILFSTHYLSEAEPADRVVMLAGGSVVADAAPAVLRAELGDQVAEIDGPGADALVAGLQGAGLVVMAHRAERGWRVGLTGSRERVTELAAAAPGIARLAIRPPTLEDVYFGRTQAPAA
jgi:ABC-type multidrug transport system ATPase subunit